MTKDKRNLPEAFLNILFKICIPTILFSLIDSVPKVFIGAGFSYYSLLWETFIRGGSWFTCALAVSQTILIMILFVYRKSCIWLVLCFSIIISVVGLLLFTYDYRLMKDEYSPWFFKSGMMAAVFLSLGGLFWKFEDKVDKLLLKNKGLPFILLVLFLALYYIFNSSCKSSVLVGINIPGFSLSIFSIICVAYLCKLLNRSNFVDNVGKQTLGLYLLSASVPFAASKIVKGLPLSDYKILGGIALMLSLLVAYALVFLMNKFVPFIYDIRKIFIIHDYRK